MQLICVPGQPLVLTCLPSWWLEGHCPCRTEGDFRFGHWQPSGQGFVLLCAGTPPVGASVFFPEQWSCNFCPLVLVNMAPGGRPWDVTLDGRGCRRWVMACVGPGIASPHTPRSLCDPSLTQGSRGGEPQQRGHMAEVEAPH